MKRPLQVPLWHANVAAWALGLAALMQGCAVTAPKTTMSELQQQVADTERAFTDIAQSLGFSEASAFNRAFKRWHGYTPGEWRLAGGAPEAPQELLF